MFCHVGFVLPQSVEKLCYKLTRAHLPDTNNGPVDQKNENSAEPLLGPTIFTNATWNTQTHNCLSRVRTD